MGRTYKQNDPHRNNANKSLREKRHHRQRGDSVKKFSQVNTHVRINTLITQRALEHTSKTVRGLSRSI